MTYNQCASFRPFSFLFIFVILISSCSGGDKSAQPKIDATQLFQNALLTATYAVPTRTPEPTKTSTITLPPSTPTAVKTPPPLPIQFQSSLLNPLDTPQTYINDSCRIIRDRWNPNNSLPGTVVMPIMFHSITNGQVTQQNQITHETAVQLLRDLKQQGFEAINMQQFVAFLYNNSRIPQRSVLLIVDDRHFRDYYDTHFQPALKDNKWTVINAWISLPDSIGEQILAGNIQLENEGFVDHQAHGVVHNVPVENWKPGMQLNVPFYGNITAVDFIKKELSGSMETIQRLFSKRPLAYIWPGGGFSPLATQLAVQIGYYVGFTVNPRGPVMYNWVPLADKVDPNRPSYAPEGPVGYPLMVIPRYWDTDAVKYIDTVRQIGKEAAAYAEQNKLLELEYYDIVCKAAYGEIPALTR